MDSNTADINLNMGSFEMERMLRQNAHEKAFEIHVLAQRMFEEEKNKIVFNGRQQLKKDQDDKVNKLNQDMNIERSKKINESRLQKMKERNKCLQEIREIMRGQLRETMSKDRPRYLATVKNLILQGMIKLIEPSLQIKCRREDVGDINKMTSDLEKQYRDFMSQETGRDEYECTLTVLDEAGMYLTEDKDQGCGGIVLYTENSRIVCPNTLANRLELAMEEMLPLIRNTLFPAN